MLSITVETPFITSPNMVYFCIERRSNRQWFYILRDELPVSYTVHPAGLPPGSDLHHHIPFPAPGKTGCRYFLGWGSLHRVYGLPPGRLFYEISRGAFRQVLYIRGCSCPNASPGFGGFTFGIATLDHKLAHNPVKQQPIVKMLVNQLYKIVAMQGGRIR